MDFSKIKKAAVLLMLGAGTLLSSVSFASVTWLSTIGVDAPVGVAVDGRGNIYVTEQYLKNRLTVFDRNGNRIRTISQLINPSAVCVDADSRIYVANGNYGVKNVAVYNSDFSFAFRLGAGNGEFKAPGGIAVSAAGLIYVSDVIDNVVKIYSRDGALIRSFGSYGGGNGQFNLPNGLFIDETNGELYVADRGLVQDSTYGSTLTGGARVQVFDLDGNFRRSFGKFGYEAGSMGYPYNLAMDRAGKLYITDPGFSPQSIHVFTSSGSWIETISDATNPLANGLGIAVGKDGRMFVASMDKRVVNVYGLDEYTTMNVGSRSLAFIYESGGANPATQYVTISNGGTGVLDWTAATATSDGGSWLAAPAAGSVSAGGSSTLSIDVNPKGLSAGVYTGTVTVTGPGALETISVQLEVTAPPAILSVVPKELSFTSQQDGPAPQPMSFAINNVGSGEMAWTATSTDPIRIVLQASSSFLTVSPNTTGLAAGNYKYPVMVTAAGAQGSPADLSVSLRIIYAGTVKVKTNPAGGAFEMTGAASYEGSDGWSNSEVVPGDYTATFTRMAGYVKPSATKFSLKSGQEVTINGDFLKKPVATHVVAGSAGKNVLVSVQPINGGELRTFSPFSVPNTNVRTAAGDFDGSGAGMIAVTDSKRTIKVFSFQGTELASLSLPDGFNNADVTAADIDKDGKTDIIVAARNESLPHRVVKVLSYASNKLQEKAAMFSETTATEGNFSIALGDVNDDGAYELMIADKSSVRTFPIDQAMAAGAALWTKSGDFGSDPRISTGDLDGDGISEIAVSYAGTSAAAKGGKQQQHAPVVVVIKGTGDDYGLTIEPFSDMDVTDASTIALVDIDEDGNDELIIGAGPASDNDPVVRIFEGNGAYAGITMKPMDGKFGVNVAAGAFK